ncbi:MAG: N-6 DNA methylase [Oscillospiraceae bacterium]|nr:N-6 DNA methylase [Oscillospiraceae bacterium]
MTNQEIVAKLWNLCNVLRDDGITYHQYVTELTYILFLKMAKETGTEEKIPEKYRWDRLAEKDGFTLKKFYEELLRELGENCSGRIQEIYSGARSNIEEPANLKKIITNINDLDWYSAKEEGLGNLYEGLLEKNANEKKSGAGQYFTPRVLIDVMTELIAPQPGERCNDPACGTFGFMIAADAYVKAHTDDLFALDSEQQAFQKKEAFTGGELVHETHRLALMNAMLHDIEGKIYLCDTLSNQGKQMNGFDVVLTNPPFGTKKGGERANRDDFTFQTSNKQLNFLQHIYRSLKADGKARAAVVLPDNVLFADGEGERIRKDLMDKCNLHTVLRLPTGIFYAQGVKTNVLFFTRGTTDKDNTKEVWFYDLRTNMPSFGKTNPLKTEHFDGFKAAYTVEDRHSISDERWSCYSYEQIAEEGKAHSLDLGLIRDDSVLDYDDLPDPIESGEECIAQLEEAVDLLMSVVKELKSLESTEV